MELVHAREEAPFLENFESIIETQWQEFALYVSQPHVADRLIARAMLTPYTHIDGYMNRYWLFNPTPPENDGRGREFEDLASVRIHHILRSDGDRHQHNHPWPARTVILKGWYHELRDREHFYRSQGSTAAVGADTFHTITDVSPGGVWTLFFSGPWVQTWGFKTERGFVPWREYLSVPEAASA